MKCTELFTILLITTPSFAQSLFTPGGTIGASTNSSVGIGTSTPAATLDVLGGVVFGTTTSGGNVMIRSYSDGRPWSIRDDLGVDRLRFSRGWSDQVFWDILKTPASDAVAGQIWYTNGAERMRITSNGNIGIGSSVPAEKLHIVGTIRSDWDNATSRIPQLQLRRLSLGVYDGTSFSVDVGMGMGQVNLNGGARLNSAGNGYNYEGTRGASRITLGDGTISLFTSNTTSGTSQSAVTWSNNNDAALMIDSIGNVGVGTTSPTQKLSVNGTVRAKEVVVETAGWSDYVLAKDYLLTSLSEVEEHIQKEGRLPGVPSAQEVAEKGVGLGEMQAKLLAKVEELTLYAIEQQKELKQQKAEIAELKEQLARVSR